jgi:hypothetical protein
LKDEWCLSPQADGEFVCAMESMRNLHTLPCGPAYPEMYRDVLSKHLACEMRVPLPPAPSHVACEVLAYERRRNCRGTRTEWRYTTADARIKLIHHYPRLTLPAVKVIMLACIDQAA